MTVEQNRQLGWTQKSGNLRASIALQTGNNTASQIKDQAIGNAFSGLSSMYTGGMFTPDKFTPYANQTPAVGNPMTGSMSAVPKTNWFG